jgi:penicillin V acylase-like amidase (Ntn superfamily)
MTNNIYEESISYLKGFKGYGGKWDMPYEADSKSRFVHAAMKLEQVGNNLTEPVDYIFGILHSVAQGQATHWSIVYDLSGKRIYFETSNNSAVRFADLSRFNFSCSQPLLAYDLFDSRSGNISDAFKPYTITESRKRVMEVNSLYKFSPANIEIIVQYPKSMQCE